MRIRDFLITLNYIKSESFTSNSSGKLEILGHDGHSLGMDSAEVSVFEESDEVGFGGFLKGHHSGALESQVSLEFLGDFSDQSLEGELSQQEISGFLIFSDFSEGNGSGSESVGLLDATGGRGLFAGSLGS
jgi:histone H3